MLYLLVYRLVFEFCLQMFPSHDQDDHRWVAGVNGSHKTLSEAQAIVDAEIQAAQTAWDNDNVDGETSEDKIRRLGDRPVDTTLEE